GLLSLTVSAILWDVVSVFAVLAALRVVGVRDWRVYAIVFFSFPVAVSLVLAQFDGVLALGCALAWRWRHTRGAKLALCLAALVVLCIACVLLARRGREDDAFIAAVAAGLLGSPILWMHYVVILLVAIAAKKRSFGAVWVIPIALWLTPTENPGSGFDFAIGF